MRRFLEALLLLYVGLTFGYVIGFLRGLRRRLAPSPPPRPR